MKQKIPVAKTGSGNHLAGQVRGHAPTVPCNPASCVMLRAEPRPDAFIAAVGAFTPAMVGLAPELCRHLAELGTVVVDTRDADHEAGDLLQARLDVSRFASLQDVLQAKKNRPPGPVLFKSCGWAGWDLAAARLALPA
jgi:ornithine cyclodeaminase